jgi:hypothetical protein
VKVHRDVFSDVPAKVSTNEACRAAKNRRRDGMA